MQPKLSRHRQEFIRLEEHVMRGAARLLTGGVDARQQPPPRLNATLLSPLL